MTDAARGFWRRGWLPLGPLGARRRSSDQESTGSGSPAHPRGRLFRKYVLLIVGLVSLVLLLNSALDFWFSYEENKAALFRIQQEKAGSAARRIEQFIDEIERQLGWTTAPQWAASPLEQRRFDYVRLLRQVPAITELIQLDDAGKEQLKVSRLAMDVVGSGKDYSQSPSFVEAKKNRLWFSPVYFRKESEPYMTVALARAGRNAGVTVAEVNLKLIWDVITGLKIGEHGYAYVVDRDGRLIADPDISLVLRNTDLSNLPQVAAAHAEASGEKAASPGAMVAKGINGNSVLTAHAAIAPLGWTVFVELPLNEALAPIYGSALRTAALFALALVLATLAALILARRMTGPIRVLQAGAARIGAGELDQRIDIRTGDELEGLAGDFNRMAGDLQKSYADLEKKVEDRTAELTEALDQQTATAEVLGVINSSPGDLAPVFDEMLEKALRLCEASFGVLCTYDETSFRAAALRGVPAAYAEFLTAGPLRPGPGNGLTRVAAGEKVVHVVDLAAEDVYRSGETLRRALVDLGGARSALTVALLKDELLLGAFIIYRGEVRAFTDKQIALVENFAAQAVIAMENARLITETREALEQQTATAEVLQVINSSPGDLAPVFDAMLEKAVRLCEATYGSMFTQDGDRFRAIALRDVPEKLAEFLQRESLPLGPDTFVGRVMPDRSPLHIADITTEEPYRRRIPIAVAGFELGGARTMLTVPLLKDDALIGFFQLVRQEVRPFSDTQIALLQNFVAQAVIAMENARLITETREALEQQTATAEVLQVINSSPGDLAPVFEAMLEKAHTLCGAAHGSLQLYDGENLHAVATHAVSDKFADILRQGYRAADSPASQALIDGKPFAHIADCAEIDHPVFRSAAEFAGIHTVLFVPLRKDGAFLGLISAARLEVRPFSEKEIALLQNFAAQAVIAMENARLITETREALEQQTATAEVLGVINSSPGDLAPVFDAMLEKATRLCEAPFGILRTWDGERFHFGAVHGDPRFCDWVQQRGPIRPDSDASLLGRIQAGERVVHIADALDDEAHRASSGFREMAEASGIRSTVTVTLHRDDALLGIITVYRQEVRPFSDKQIALLQNFAAQAVIAMENARLITETREALEQQTATAEVLQVINSSPGNLAPVFDAVLDKATRFCDAAFGTLWTYDGERFKAVALQQVPEAYAEFLSRAPIRPVPFSGLGRVAAGESVAHFLDVAANEAYRGGDPGLEALLELGKARSTVAVPLRKDNAVLGAITAYRQEVRPFSDKQIALLQNFAAQAVIAMENARLITETREALEQQTATAEVLQVINSSPSDLTPVFSAILEKAHGLCGITFGTLQLYDGEKLRAVAMRGFPEPLEKVIREPYAPEPESPLLGLINGGRFVQIRDLAEHDTQIPNPRSRIAVDLGIRTLLFLPLRKDDLLLGLISAARTEAKLFSEREIALLENFAAQAVIAMENARLITETREALEQQTATAEVLGVINSSPGDLAPVFDAMLEKATRLCEGTQGVLWNYDGERFRPAAMFGVSVEFVAEMERAGRPGTLTPMGRIARGERLVQIVDLAADESYRAGEPVPRVAVEIGGFRSLIAVALVKNEALLGAFVVSRREVRAFSEKQIALLQNFAAQAVIAMENARLLTETREALEQQTATAEVLQVINSSPGDLAPVFEAILEKAHSLCGAMYGSLHIADGEAFRGVAVRGMPEAFADFIRQPIQPGSNHPVRKLIGGAPFAAVINSPEFDDPVIQSAFKLGDMRTGLFVPLRKDNVLLGYIVASRREARPFSDKQIALLQNFAAQAVIAMENARLITETREALEQQTATAEVLQVINSSPGDLAPVFDSILEKAHALCGAAFGGLLIYDGDRFRTVALHGVPAAFAEIARQGFLPDAPNPIRPLLNGEPLVHIADLKEIADAALPGSLPRAAVDLAGIRTLLMVPLRKDDALLGVITAYRQEVRPFSDKQIALLQNFAAQAVIAMENARLITETREALDQQTATAEVLQVINSSPGDLAPVFDAMLDKAMRLCEAAFGTLWTYDGACVHAAALHNVPPVFAEFLTRAPHQVGPDSAHGRLLRGEPVVHIPDIVAEKAYRLGDPIRRALVELGGGRTLLAVPLRKDNTFLGDFVIYRQEARPFSDKQIALLQNFAAQAVIAMENARLINETREALEKQTATAEILRVISGSPTDVQPTFDAIATNATILSGAEAGGVFQFDGSLIHFVAHYGWPADVLEAVQRDFPIRPGRHSTTARAILTREVAHIPDAAADPEYALPAVLQTGVRTMLSVPILQDGNPVGAITVTRREVEAFSQAQIDLLKTFADQAVIAIENVRLFTELNERTRDLQESLEYQTATSDVLKVISQSTFDLEPVLQTVLDTAMRLCGNSQGEIFRLEDGAYRMAVGYGMEPEYHDIEARLAIPPGPDTLVGRTALAGRPVQIVDALADPDYAPKDDAQIGRLRSMLGVPLLREGVPIGVICTARTTVEPFTAKQIELVSTFADQAVIAIENARLFNELRARTAELGSSVAELKMLSEVGQAVSSTLDLRTVLSTVLNASLGVTWANAGAIFRYIRAERAFRLVEAVGWDEPLLRSVRDLRVAEAETAMGEAAARRMPIQLAELAERPSAPLRDASLAAGFHSALIVPLVGAERILGAIILMRQEAGEFPAETVRLMQTLASQSVLAIQNARLFREIADKSEQLALASQHKSQFLANMSHELRTPLNAILGYAELLVDGIYGVLPDRPKGVLERIQNNGKHLLALINDVLDLAKIEAGQLTLTLEDYSVPEVVKSVVSATEPLAASKGLKFTAALQDDLPMAHGDARRVSQVLLNLVGNAIKFTDEGEVEIRASADKGQFVLTVRDTGPGIADADQDRIFGEFQQIDNTDTRKKGGTGLGLAISKRMVEMQGGTIAVDSALGQGSTFRVVLPVHVDEMMEAA